MEDLELHQAGGKQHQIKVGNSTESYGALQNGVLLYQMGTYVLGFIDYHWNISEHYVLGKHGHLEAQLHHYDLSYGTYEEAVEVPGAVLSIALLFKVKKEYNWIRHMWKFSVPRRALFPTERPDRVRP